jgi:hypothetical protein
LKSLVRRAGEIPVFKTARQSVQVCLVLCFAVLLALGPDLLRGQTPEIENRIKAELELERALKKASVDGKYRMLLRQIKVADDKGFYGDFNDYGIYEKTEYMGHKDLPKGYWVYASPYWYIWRELSTKPKLNRNWGPEQATGAPDTNEAGDFPTAWASQTPDGQDEWLLLEYEKAILPKEVVVHESFNPGALVRVTAFKLDGEEVEVWKGKDPTTPDKASGVSVIPLKIDFRTNRIRLHLDSRNVPGWNEIDAVGLKDKDGKVQWAQSAEASSTYAEQTTPAPAPPPAVDRRDERIRQLEKEVAELKKTLERIEKLLQDKNK